MNAAQLYQRVREKEKRIYSDAIVAQLPIISRKHTHADEWRARADSCKRLIRYLSALNKEQTILDLGCGNGWMCRRLAEIPNSRVLGIDRDSPELRQAARLFSSPNLTFVNLNIFQPALQPSSIDILVIASAIQYFPNLQILIATSLPLLRQNAEIHILDSPLYRPDEVSDARERTCAYYTAIGLPEMGDHYFHHLSESLEIFKPTTLYSPSAWSLRLKRLLGLIGSPFPWLRLRTHA
ncbi:MAG: class I SAM-dependent methyltransferase [Anaerolineae bacterium]|nr:class I SAM-dependent methyltransferase [Anaerolineae bacterium]MDK1081127.1 class I SAM-dependent methyltransferase [Anaerolineae bacterium]